MQKIKNYKYEQQDVNNTVYFSQMIWYMSESKTATTTYTHTLCYIFSIYLVVLDKTIS